MENTLFAYFENQLFPSPVQPQLRDSLQLFLYDCCIPNNGDTPFYRRVVQRKLDTIPQDDRERYFQHYAQLHTVQVIAENFSITGQIAEKTAVFCAVCCQHWSVLGCCGMFRRFCGSSANIMT